jgi:anti-sigma regulatory factor (Ser/Thr protein kinase)
LILASRPTAPREAREFLAQACAAWGVTRFVELGSLVVSELVSNAVMHTGTEIGVQVQLEQGCLRIDVHDHGGGLPAIVPPGEWDIGGVGLEIVSRCARQWGSTPDGQGGKHVWAVLA